MQDSVYRCQQAVFNYTNGLTDKLTTTVTDWLIVRLTDGQTHRWTGLKPVSQTCRQGSQCHFTLGEQEKWDGFIFPRTGGRDMSTAATWHSPSCVLLSFFFLWAIIFLSALDLVFLQSPCCDSVAALCVSRFDLLLQRIPSAKGLHLPIVLQIGQAGLVLTTNQPSSGTERHSGNPSVPVSLVQGCVDSMRGALVGGSL